MMPHKRYFSVVIVVAPTGLEGIAWVIFDGRTRIEETRAKRLRTRSADPR